MAGREGVTGEGLGPGGEGEWLVPATLLRQENDRLERDLRQHWLEQWRKFALPLERLLHNRVLELVQYRLKSVIKHLLQVCEHIVA